MVKKSKTFTCNEHDLPDEFAGGVTLTADPSSPYGLRIEVNVDGRILAAYLGPVDAKRLSLWIKSKLPDGFDRWSSYALEEKQEA